MRRGARGEHDFVRADCARDGDPAARHRDLQEPVTREIERGGAVARVGDARANQAAIGGPPGEHIGQPSAQIARLRRARGGDGEIGSPCHEIAIGHVDRRSGEGSGIHAAGAGDHDPVGIDQIDAAVGVDLPRDHRGRVASDAIEQGRLRVGLNDVDAVALRDREVAPVDDRAVAGLIDPHAGRIRRRDRGRSSDDLALRRQRLRVHGGGNQCRRCRQHGEPGVVSGHHHAPNQI